MRRRIVVIAAAAATVLVGAGVAVAAYVAFLAPEDGPPTPRATLSAPDPAERAGPKPAPQRPPQAAERDRERGPEQEGVGDEPDRALLGGDRDRDRVRLGRQP